MIKIDPSTMRRLEWLGKQGGPVWMRWDGELCQMRDDGLIVTSSERHLHREILGMLTRFGRAVVGLDNDRRKLRMSCREFRELHEYSSSIPTGVTIGKRWKCQRRLRVKPGEWPYLPWRVGEYAKAYVVIDQDGREHPMATIDWYDVILRPTTAELEQFAPNRKLRVVAP